MTETDLPPTPGAPPGFPHEENGVRHVMGLTKDQMRALRHGELTAAIDFKIFKKRIYLSAAGAQRLLNSTGLPPAKKTPESCLSTTTDDGAPVKNVPAKKTPAEIVQLRVVRCDLRNPHLLLACAAAEDPDRPKTTVRVRVRSVANFIRRMELPALLVDGHTDLYDLAHALPRKRGKW
jgi:hypothetical protein